VPRVLILGSAQDGGLPHLGCLCAYCERARREPAFRRAPACLGLLARGAYALVDATNAFAEQLHAAWLASVETVKDPRFFPPAAIVLTHAHTGHYTGLWQLDRSVLATREAPVLATPRLGAFLAAQQPWAWMLAERFITFGELTPDAPTALLDDLRVTPLVVPHRAEWDTDTVGLLIEGPTRRAFYLPDIDSWDAWERDIIEVVASVDIAILDGCFWEPFHIPGVPHPPIRETLDRLQPLADAGKEIVFTHLNHSCAAVDPASAESAEIRQRGFHVAREGDVFEL
jgi:pyrroloquinoline quinone biosynthesis protein B